MPIKSTWRKAVKAERRQMTDKAQKDAAIAARLFALPAYQKAKTVLAYASLPDEVNTDVIIERALADGKTVAVPYCEAEKGIMTFYTINSLSDLHSGSYGIREPQPRPSALLTDFCDALILVPALCFDANGYRLGYGGGYYDRFLEKHSFISVGLCYNSLIKNDLPKDKHDKSVSIVITESTAFICDNGEKNG